MRLLTAIVLIVSFAMPTRAAEDQRGWAFSGYVTGTSNSSGLILKVNPSVGYSFNKYFRTYAGLPFYFVDASVSSTSNGFVNGIGNAYVGIGFGIDDPALNFASNLVISAPTGDRSRGFSTGRVTADWTNDFSRPISIFRPFGSVGVANTISDTSFFVRPFTSYGLVGHFEGGTTVDLLPRAYVGASAYGVKASGEQRIASKVFDNPGRGQASGSRRHRPFETSSETVSSPDIADDYGFSTWFGVTPQSNSNFYVGYSRSTSYDFNTLFFGVGFRIGN